MYGNTNATLAKLRYQERDGSGNRYILVSSSMWMVDMARALKKADPTRPIVRRFLFSFFRANGQLPLANSYVILFFFKLPLKYEISALLPVVLLLITLA